MDVPLLEVLREYDSLTRQLARDFHVAEEPTRAMIARMAIRNVCARCEISAGPQQLEKLVEAILLARP